MRMRYLMSGSTKTVRSVLNTHPHLKKYLGWLQTPNQRIMAGVKGLEMPVYVDNAAFTGFDRKKFIRTLRGLKAASIDPRWVAVPDVPFCAKSTIDSFYEWVRALPGLKLAFVGQDGQEDLELPEGISCFFVGGSTEWKLSRSAFDLVRECKRRGLWVHMGRVNSVRRIRIAMDWGCDSVDGTGPCRWGNKYLLKFLEAIHAEKKQLRLGGVT